MPFSETWNAAFEAIPADSEGAKLGAGRIRDLKRDLRERMAIEHSWSGDANDGKHTDITANSLTATSIGAFNLTGNITSTGNKSINIGTGALTAGAISGTTGAFTKATAGAVLSWTNGGATPKTGYLYSDANYIGMGDTTNLSGNYIYITPASNSATIQLNNSVAAAFTGTTAIFAGSIGGVLGGAGTTPAAATVTTLSASAAVNATTVLNVTNSGNSTPFGINLAFSAAAPNDTTRYAFSFADTGATRATLWSDGSWQIAAGKTYGNFSDISLKNLRGDTEPWLSRVRQLQVRDYELKTQLGTVYTGFIAQEFERVMPDLVYETTQNGRTLKSIGESGLIPRLTKSIQELAVIGDDHESRLSRIERQLGLPQ